MLGAKVRGCFLFPSADRIRKGSTQGKAGQGSLGDPCKIKNDIFWFLPPPPISASQKQLCELQGVAGANQRKEGSKRRRKENGTSKSPFVTVVGCSGMPDLLFGKQCRPQ